MLAVCLCLLLRCQYRIRMSLSSSCFECCPNTSVDDMAELHLQVQSNLTSVVAVSTSRSGPSEAARMIFAEGPRLNHIPRSSRQWLLASMHLPKDNGSHSWNVNCPKMVHDHPAQEPGCDKLERRLTHSSQIAYQNPLIQRH
jgi:hypothetical protein